MSIKAYECEAGGSDMRMSFEDRGSCEATERSGKSRSLKKIFGYSVFGFQGNNLVRLAQWLSWLQRRPVTAEVDGSSPFWVVFFGILAQLGEHLPYKQGVTGSSPVAPTK